MPTDRGFWGRLLGGRSNGHGPDTALAEPILQGKAGEISGVATPFLDSTLQFFSPDGTRTIYRFGTGNSEAEHVNAATAYAAAAYAFAALRWRAARMAEAPPIVVREDPKTGEDDWQPKHGLAPLLDAPSPDYDMSELLFRTSLSIDMHGQALWKKDADRGGVPRRLILFRGNEFTIEQTSDRIRGLFRVRTVNGEKSYKPEEIVYFHEPDPNNWLQGLSRLEVFLGWLNLGQAARAAVRDLLDNSAWPSLIVQTDPEWNPDDKLFETYKQNLKAHTSGAGKKGDPLVMLGGGTATVVSSNIKDLVPDEILNRVESIAAAIFGVPAIVLQFEVGLQNSPWSQMKDARRMAYEDTAEAIWKQSGEIMTRQLLRPFDEDATLFIRHDTSRITALQADQTADTVVAMQWAELATLNERRQKAGLEKVKGDPEADKYPWQQAAERRAEFEARVAQLSEAGKQPDGSPKAPGEDPEPDDPEAAKRRQRARLEAKRSLWAALRADQIHGAELEWQLLAAVRLDADLRKTLELWEKIAGAEKADAPIGPEKRRRFFRSLRTYLEGESASEWNRVADPLAKAHAERAAATVIADIGMRFDLAKPGIAEFARDEVGFLVKSVTTTTREAIEAAVSSGLESGESIRDIARKLQGLPAFSRDRAMLVARTESARVMNGAPTAMLKERSAATGRKFMKTWLNSDDGRVRDEHLDVSEGGVSGETVAVGESFSNGLEYPSEPNCRCVVTFEEVDIP